MAGIKVIDWLGTLVLTGGLVMFLLGLQFGSATYPWSSATVIGLIVGGCITLILFIPVEWSFARNPIIPMHLFTNISNLAAILVDLFHGVTFTLVAYFLPLYFQSVLGESPLMSGVILLPYVLALSFTSASVGIFLKITGRYVGCIIFGFVLSVLGCGLFYDLPGSKKWVKIILYQIVAGIGIGANFQPPLVALQSNVSIQDNGTVTATFSLIRNVASAIAVVIGSVAFANGMQSQQGQLRSELGPDLASSFSRDNAQANIPLIESLDDHPRNIVRQAFLHAIRNVWIEAVCFAAVGLIVCLFIRNAKLDETHTEVKFGLEGEAERHRIAQEKRKRT